MAPTTRVRRSPDQARSAILDVAESLLADGGVAAVQVRAIAARVGMTDAGIYHHFGTRDQLLEALLRHGGHKIRAGLQELTRSWLDHGTDLAQLVDALAGFYRQGYGELGVALHAAGWRDKGSGMLAPVVEALHASRPDAADVPVEDTRLAVAALHQALATDPLYGPAFRRSAGITGRAATTHTAQLRWWTTHLTRSLGHQVPPTTADADQVLGPT
jgi:TetR/AcrR family transcriptional regulator, repressor for neighboring sulfatase